MNLQPVQEFKQKSAGPEEQRNEPEQNTRMNLNRTQVFVTVHSRISFIAKLKGMADPWFARGQLAVPWERQVNKSRPRLN